MFNIPLPWQAFTTATWQTIYMVFVAGFISILTGLAIGLLLHFTRRGQGTLANPVYQILGLIVNIGRSVPFIILMIAIIPLTKYLVGTTIGTNAAIVSLTLAAIPFYARIAEAAISEVPTGLMDAAQAMGATRWQIIHKVLIPESLPTLINGGTLTVIALIGYSAMAGVIGGGGLGQLAVNYGYQQFEVSVMVLTVIILVILVQLVQILGDWLAAHRQAKPLWILSLLLWIVAIATQAWPTGAANAPTLTIGITSGPQQQVMAVAKRVAWQRYHLQLMIKPFDDYNLPNAALASGSIDANIFQHVPFLDAQIKAHGYKIKSIARTFVYPMGIFSKKIHNIAQLKAGDLVAIPNDPSNLARSLLLLAKHRLITLKPGVGVTANLQDIVSNPDNLRFKLLNAAQVPRALNDVTLGAVTNDYIKPAGLKLSGALLREGPHAPYANVIVVRDNDRSPLFAKLIKIMHSKAVLDKTLSLFPDGSAIPAWSHDK